MINGKDSQFLRLQNIHLVKVYSFDLQTVGEFFTTMGLLFGFFVLGFYLIQISKGKSFNSSELSKFTNTENGLNKNGNNYF